MDPTYARGQSEVVNPSEVPDPDVGHGDTM